VRPRHLAPVAAVLALTIAGFLGARLLGERQARRDSEHRAELAAEQIRARVRDAASLAESLGRFMTSGRVTSQAFATNASRWLSPAGFPAAAWVQRVPASRRAAYERRIGHPIVTRDRRRRIVPVGARSSYVAATLASDIPPTAMPGIDLGGVPGLDPTLSLSRARDSVRATPLATLRDGTQGLFLVRPAPRRNGGVVEPGFAVVFVPTAELRTAVTYTGSLLLTAGGTSIGERPGGAVADHTFTEAGRRFDVVVAHDGVSGAAGVLPWIILAAGLMLAALADALGVSAGRRSKAKAEVDRLFTLTPDLITVAGSDGSLKRVNPAFEARLGYTESEVLGRPAVEFVHPDDRSASLSESRRLLEGATILVFENRLVCKDGSHRWIEWTATPVPEEGLLYGIGRDVTERRHAETELERLVAQQESLRRVATLVAKEAPPEEVFEMVAEEVARALGDVDCAAMRDEGDGTASAVAVWGSRGFAGVTLGDRLPLDGDSVVAVALAEGQPARVDDYSAATGTIAERVRGVGIRSAVACPIVFGQRVWGALVVGAYRDDPPPPETEARLAQFSELVATSIANAEARDEMERLASEQAALRRVATLVAKESPPAEVFAKVAEEVASVLGDAECSLFRDEGDGTATVVALWGLGDSPSLQIGGRWPIDGNGVIASVLRDGRPRRIGDYSGVIGALAVNAREQAGIRSAVGCPIVVRGHVWGAMVAARHQPDAFPPNAENRLARFAELAATTIANAEARAQVERLAAEQAALRRVATLVAKGASPMVVFDAVAAELEALLGADRVTLSRYERGDEITVVAHRGSDAVGVPPGTRVNHEGRNVTTTVRRSERPARMEKHGPTQGAIAGLVDDIDQRTSVGAPVVVDGGLWGVAVATWHGEESPPADTEQRMAQFAQLLDTAIANADSRDQLTASRARLLTAADEARRRVVRDLHDGAQQRLVHTVITLKLAQRALHQEKNGDAESLIADALDHAQQGNTELRELAHGLLPAVLSRGGLQAGVSAVVARLDLPVELDVTPERFPAEIEASAYFVAAEALTNVVKHARAQRAAVTAFVEDGTLCVEVRDDGVGGADPDGHGLVGMADRVAALEGRLKIESPVHGRGTRVTATLPLPSG
jgi:PAS domain S-box-containing protein